MQISGFAKTTLLDYPGHLASTIFLGGCNFNCSYCHNSELIHLHKDTTFYDWGKVYAHLKKRSNILEGVCISGGEPTLQPDLAKLFDAIHALGLKTKLDTNGSNPSVIKQLLDNQLVDYIAMDIKNSKEEYSNTIGLSSININDIEKSVDVIRNSSIDYEFRTTLVREFHSAASLCSIGEWLAGSNAYYLQNYKESENVPDKTLHPFDKKEILYFKELLKPMIPNTHIRGID